MASVEVEERFDFVVLGHDGAGDIEGIVRMKGFRSTRYEHGVRWQRRYL